MTTTAGRGRRPGGPDTRGEILDAARASFAARGFVGTTIRGVAAAAGVDPSLVHHYFGSKDDLFVAALEMPADPREVVPRVFAAGLDDAGPRLLEAVLAIWDDPEARRPLEAVIRSAVATEPGGRMFSDGMLRLVLTPMRAVLPPGEADQRAQLLATQMLGLVLARYILRLEPLASMPRSAVVAWVGPTLQRYLTGPMPS